MRKHTVVGERIVSASPALRPVGRIVRSSHERWDGKAIPTGSRVGTSRSPSRIVCACDAFSAMTTSRPYHEAMSVDAALAELERCSGSQFDPAVVSSLLALVRAGFDMTEPPEAHGTAGSRSSTHR